MAQFRLGQKVKLIAKPQQHCAWPVGTTGVIRKLPSPNIGFVEMLFGQVGYTIDPDTPNPMHPDDCKCPTFCAPASCLVPINYDGYEPFTEETVFDFSNEEQLEKVS